MESDSDLAPRRQGEKAPSMASGFPSYLPVPSRQRSRSRHGAGSDTDTAFSGPPVVPPRPPKGILKNSPSRQQEIDNNRLAARFYRIPRPVQTHLPRPAYSPLPSPSFYGSESAYTGNDGDTDINSSASELSVNTQATSVASDYSDYKRLRNMHIRHVRPVPIRTAARVRARPRTRAGSEVSRSDVSRSDVSRSVVSRSVATRSVATRSVATKAHSQASTRRTVHIKIMPNKNKTTPAPSQSMQLARIPNRTLVNKLERLESGTEDLRHDRRDLARRLDHASEELTLKAIENDQITQALEQERSSKQLVLRDLEEQRRQFDEFRSSFDWQQALLMNVERERDDLRQARSDAERRLVDLENDMYERERRQKEQDEHLRYQLTNLATTASTLEERVLVSEEKLRGLAMERDDLRARGERYQLQINVLRKQKKSLPEERLMAEAIHKKLRAQLDAVTAENQGLHSKITGLEGNIVALQAQISELSAQKKGLEDTLASERASKDELQKSSSAERDAEKQLSADREEAQKQLIAEKEELGKRLEATKGDLERQLQATKDDLEKQLEDSNVTLNTQIEVHRVEVADLQLRLNAGEIIKGDLERELEAAKGELSAIAGVKGELEKEGAAWRAEKDNKQSMIDGLITDLAGAKDANKSLASERLEAEKKLNEVEAHLANVQAELAELQAAHKNVESDNEQLRAQAGDLSRKAADLDRLQVEKTAEIEKLQSVHTELDGKIRVLQSDLDLARTAHVAIRDEKEKLEMRAKELEDGTLLAKLKAEKAELAEQISSLQADAAKVHVLMQANAELEGRASALQDAADRVFRLEQSKTDLQRANLDLERAKMDLEGRMAVAQGEASLVPGLQNQIDRLNEQIRDIQTPSSSRHHRGSSRSSSRAPSKKRERSGRSPSSGSGAFLFVRNPAEKGGNVYITTRDALSRERERGD